MIPVHLDPAHARIALVGRGALAVRRLAWLNEGGASVDVWSDLPSTELEGAAKVLERRLPNGEDIARYHAVWIADLDEEQASVLAGWAREARVLVNVEDNVRLCDFHTPATIRRGRLTVSAGTGGASPAVARMVRERLDATLPEAWTDALEDIARARVALRAQGAPFETLIAAARERLAARDLI